MKAKYLVFALVFLATIGGALAVVSDNLVAYWRMNDTGTFFPDATNKSHNGTYINVGGLVTVQGKINEAKFHNISWMAISGTSYINVSNTSQIGNITYQDFTLNFWVKYNSTPLPGYYGTFWSSYDLGGGCERGIAALTNPTAGDESSLRFEIYDGTSDRNLYYSPGSTLYNGQWHMITMVRNSTQHYIYFDKILGNSLTLGSPINASSYPTQGSCSRKIQIGATDGSYPIANNVSMDEIGFWNVSLGADELTVLYNNSAGYDPTSGESGLIDTDTITTVISGNSSYNGTNYARNVSIYSNILCGALIGNKNYSLFVNDTKLYEEEISCASYAESHTTTTYNYTGVIEGNNAFKIYVNGTKMQTINVTFDVNNPVINYLNFSTPSAGLSTTNTTMYFNCTDAVMGNVTYNVTFNDVNFVFKNNTNGTLYRNDSTLKTAGNTLLGVCSDLFGSTLGNITTFFNYLNITFYYEPTDTLFQPDVITAILISNVTNGTNTNGTTTTGSLAFSGMIPAYYEIRYSSPGFVERTYYFTLSAADANTSNVSLSLYLINTSLASVITITVKNQDLELVNEAEVRFLRYFQDTQTYQVVDETVTANNGQGVVNLVLNDVYYKAIILYQGNVVYETEPFRVTSQALTFNVPIGGAGFTLINPIGISSNMTYETTLGGYFQFTYADISGLSSTGCLEVTANFLTGNNVLCTSCVSSSSGSMTCAAIQSNGTSITARGYVTDSSGNRYLVQVYEKSFSDAIQNFGLMGVFITLIIMLITVFAGIKSPETGVFGCVIGLVASLIFGIVYMTILNIILLAIAVVIVLSTRGRE